MEHITSHPLCWPEGWKKESEQIRSRFGKWDKPISVARATDFVLDELFRMGIPDYMVIISTNLQLRNDGLPRSNQREPDDTGVSVWWNEYNSDDSDRKVIAIDKYDRVADNLWAIAKTIEAMRGIERWGSGEIMERTFTGFQALPPSQENTIPQWWQILDVDPTDPYPVILKSFKRLRSKYHPDKITGDPDKFKSVISAFNTYKGQ